jgi:site-specific recombinase XerD
MRAKARARIHQHGYPYSLRHAYATPMLEGGANLRVIQLLLGPRSLRTTQVDTQVADPQLQATPSPLARLPDRPSLPPATS